MFIVLLLFLLIFLLKALSGTFSRKMISGRVAAREMAALFCVNPTWNVFSDCVRVTSLVFLSSRQDSVRCTVRRLWRRRTPGQAWHTHKGLRPVPSGLPLGHTVCWRLASFFLPSGVGPCRRPVLLDGTGVWCSSAVRTRPGVGGYWVSDLWPGVGSCWSTGGCGRVRW